MEPALSAAQVRLTPVHRAQCRTLVRVEVRIGARISYPTLTDVIVVGRWEFEITITRYREYLLHRACWAYRTPVATGQHD